MTILHSMIIEHDCDLNAPIEVVREVVCVQVEIVENNNIRFKKIFGRLWRHQEQRSSFHTSK